MQRRPLGNSDIMVSELALGTWAMGGVAEKWGLVDDNESIATINHAIESGINLIDTAPIYGDGHSETLVGRAVAGRREDVVIATKCGIFPTEGGAGPKRCLTRQSIFRECEASLRRLHTGYVDLYQCHWPDPDTPIRETMEALVTLRRQGKIRAIGLSNFSSEQIAAAMEFGPIHSLQAEFSLLHRRAAMDLLPYCREHGIAVLAYSPLGKGLLTGKFSADSRITGVRADDPQYHGVRFARNLAFVEQLRPIAAGYGRAPGELALNWVASFPGITSAIFGAKRPSQVLDNVGAAGWRISPTDLDRIEELTQAL